VFTWISTCKDNPPFVNIFKLIDHPAKAFCVCWILKAL
jgi:hypothetical protein